MEAFEDYYQCIEPVVRFLQGKDPSLALRIANQKLVPQGPRFLHLQEHENVLDFFGDLGLQDKAKYIASLFIDDIADVIKHSIDERFEFSRYGESLASSQTSFNLLYENIKKPPTFIDHLLFEIVDELILNKNFEVVRLSTPFPGNVYAAFKIANRIKQKKPEIKIILGGGFVNTELREMSDIRPFEFIDYMVFDDGERPVECILEYLQNKRSDKDLLRTWYLQDNQIQKISSSAEKDIPFKFIGTPDYEGLKLDQYVAMLEMPNPMYRMWSDFRWNKMILAHGCYWKKCNFCDISLDYIQRFEPSRVDKIVDHLEDLVKKTGNTGFHFVDEAAPPAILKAMSQEIIKRGLKINWWGNLRFDVQFTPEVAELMADAGCVAVTGGLEVASPRLLKLINKGVTIEQVAKVTKAFVDNGIYVHAYLMYGFATQTEQETIDSLEVVRQLFENQCLHSAFWHRFMVTAHSPVGKNPEQFGIKLKPRDVPREGLFAKNEIPFEDPTGTNHDLLGLGLKKALYNYMHGIGLKEDVRFWFEHHKAPKTVVDKNLIAKALK